MTSIEERFEIRPFSRPAYARDAGVANAVEEDVALGDEVVLQPAGHDRAEEVYVRVSAMDEAGALTGTIDRANRLGSRGCPGLRKGDMVRFAEKNVIRVVRGGHERSQEA